MWVLILSRSLEVGESFGERLRREDGWFLPGGRGKWAGKWLLYTEAWSPVNGALVHPLPEDDRLSPAAAGEAVGDRLECSDGQNTV